ncbi:g11695 [Coccomyxa elongata]
MHSRDARRNQGRLERAMQAGQENGGDLYAKRIPENATGGVALGPASAASAAVERAAALGGPRMLRCDLCQANFSGDALYQQHLNGPIHKKALAKEEARRLRDLQMGASRGAAESAMAAAAWANDGSLSARGAGSRPLPTRPAAQPQSLDEASSSGLPPQQAPPGSGGGYHHAGSTGVPGRLTPAASGPGRGLKGRGRGAGGRGEDAAAAEEARRAAQISHAELVARAQKDSGPISIGGWVPPSVSRRPVEEGERSVQAVPDEDHASDQSASDPAGPESGDDGEEMAEIPPQAEDGADAGLGSLVDYSEDDSSDDSDDERAARPKIVSFF